MLSSDPEYAGRPDTPAPIPCEYCGALRYHLGVELYDGVRWFPSGPQPCTCHKATESREAAETARRMAEAAKREAVEAEKLRTKTRRILSESGMGERFRRRTFETFEITDSNRRAAAAAKRYADGFSTLLPKPGEPEPGRNGLFISGPPGTGKTHIAAAIANHLLAKGTPAICMTMIDLLERIKRTYTQAAMDGEDESSILSLYKTVPLLVIDDIGKEPPTEWAISTVYNIINGRYEAYMPTIITTNYDTETLISRMTPRETRDSQTAKATIDRLMEMCRGISLTGESWRQR